MANDRNETPITNALAVLRDGTDVPPIDSERERALLAAFDGYWTQPRRSSRSGTRRGWTALTAAAVAIAAAFAWMITAPPWRTSETRTPPLEAAVDTAGFVPWPGSDAWPPFESGELVRVDLPVSALPALGLWPPASSAAVVQADIVVGQDGFARAVRLVP
jgi:hypothetical protein